MATASLANLLISPEIPVFCRKAQRNQLEPVPCNNKQEADILKKFACQVSRTDAIHYLFIFSHRIIFGDKKFRTDSPLKIPIFASFFGEEYRGPFSDFFFMKTQKALLQINKN